MVILLVITHKIMKIINTIHKNQNVTIIQKQNTPLVSVYLTAEIGLAQNVKDYAVRSLFCDLIMSGAGDLNREQFLDAVNGAGGSISARVNEGRLTITFETTESRLPKILRLAKLMLVEPNFASKEVARAKTNYMKQLRVASEQARTMSLINLIQLLYTPAERSYQYTPEQEIEVLKNIKTKDFCSMHKVFLFSPWIITIGTNHNAAPKIKNFFAKLAIDAGKTSCKSNIKKSNNKFVAYQITSQQNIEVSIGQRLPLTFKDDDYPAVVFALAVLGRWGGFSGRLMSTVREKEGLTYGIYARNEATEKDSYGHWRIMTFFHPSDLERGLQSVFREIIKLYKNGITKNEHLRFKKILETNHILLFDSLISLTKNIHAHQVKDISYAEYENMMQRMQKLTIKEINTAIKKYLDPNNLSCSLAGNLEPLSSQLKNIRRNLKL